MTAERDDPDRHLIPRWRSVNETAAAGEFQKRPTALPLDKSLAQQLELAHNRWKEEKTEVAAAELAGAAIALGEPVSDDSAIELLSRSEQTLLHSLAARSSRGSSPVTANSWGQEAQQPSGGPLHYFRRSVAFARRRTARDPRNPIAWADLARAYTTLGEAEKARQALRIARALAPYSRYLLRAEARLLLQLGEPDRALRTLQASPRTKSDPWLMAASLSVAASGGLVISGVRAAKRLLEHGDFRPIELSDLQSEIATLELASGGRRARSMFQRSLTAPTDNSLAQAAWASRRVPNLDVDVDLSSVPFRSEAMARTAEDTGMWQESLRHALDWLADQPFDEQAAIHASYVAAAGVDDWDTARAAAEIGVSANPESSLLINNLAYALVELGELEQAAQWLGRIPGLAEGVETVALDATRGLLLFRIGDPEGGTRYYRRSLASARRDSDERLEAIALGMLVREEARCGVTSEQADIERLEELLMKVADPGAHRIASRGLAAAGRK